jgi:hypothetical protein
LLAISEHSPAPAEKSAAGITANVIEIVLVEYPPVGTVPLP